MTATPPVAAVDGSSAPTTAPAGTAPTTAPAGTAPTTAPAGTAPSLPASAAEVAKPSRTPSPAALAGVITVAAVVLVGFVLVGATSRAGASTASAPYAFGAAYDEFSTSYRAALAAHPGDTYSDAIVLRRRLVVAAATLANSLDMIAWPDNAKADAQSLVGAVGVFLADLRAATNASEADLPMTGAVGQTLLRDIQAVKSAAAILRSDFGFPEPS